VRRLTGPVEVERALTAPPAATRAAARSRFIEAASARNLRFTVDWQSCTVHDLPGPDGRRVERTLALADPRESRSAELEDLLAMLGRG